MLYDHLYKGKVKYISDYEYTNNQEWVVGELQTKVKRINGKFKLVPCIHFFVTVTRQYILFEHLQDYMDRKAEIFEITVEVDKTSLYKCTGKKDKFGEWIFEKKEIKYDSRRI